MAKKPTPPNTEKPASPPSAATKGEVKTEPSGVPATKSEASPEFNPASSPKGSGGHDLPKAGPSPERGAGSGQVPSPAPAATPVSSADTAERPPKSLHAKAGSPKSPPAAATAGAPQQEPALKGDKPSVSTTEPRPPAAAPGPAPGIAGSGAPRVPSAQAEPPRPTAKPVTATGPAPAPEAKAPFSREPSAERGGEPPIRSPREPEVELEVEPQSEMLPEPGPGLEPAPHYQSRPSLYIVHVTPEMAPVAKVGGLADVVFGLTRELAIRGNHVEIILPKYDNLRYDHILQMHEVYRDLWVPWYGGAIHCTVYFSFVHDRKCFFIEPHSNDNFFNRGSLYGFRDDVLRFAFFSRAAMEFMWQAGKHPDVIHCHDWQTALVPVFLYEIYQPLGMHHPRVCMTIHNFKHQGVTGAELLRATGLNRPERFMAYERLGDNHHRGALNLLKGGIVYSNFVATVSPRYAYETKDQGQGFGLEPTLHTHHMKYGGVVNGVDYDVWNPEVDTHIPVRFNVDTIDGKYENKRALRHRLMLADNEKPLVAFIGRLDPQKGLELVRHGIFYSLGKGAQFVLLGSSPDHGISADFWGLKHMLNDNPDCHLEIGFDEDLSHLIYAGADIILVPSQFEPCGLTQLIALRYGTIPVVRSIGGLADTVFDKDHSFHPLHERNGYSFETYDNPGLESALGRAIACYYEYPDHFRDLMKNAMRSDYSWNHPGQDYLNIYDYIRHH